MSHVSHVSHVSQAIPEEVTRLLLAWSEGDQHALGELMPLVCHDLRRMALFSLRKEGKAHELRPTELVNEFFLKIHKSRKVDWQDRGHFFGTAAKTMRMILVDRARYAKRQKRGGGDKAVSTELDSLADARGTPQVEIIDLDNALKKLEEKDPRMAKVVDLRYIIGMTVEETAAALDISAATVKREWQFAKLWLFSALNGDTDS